MPKMKAKKSTRLPTTIPAMAPPDKGGDEFGVGFGICEEDERGVMSASELLGEAIGVVEGRPMRPKLEAELVADERIDEDVVWKLSTGLIQLPTRGCFSAAL